MPNATGRLVGTVMIQLAFGALLIAGIAKFVSLDAFAASLLTWDPLPRPIVPSLSIAIPAIECSVAGLWFLRLWPRACALAYVGLLIVFSAALALQVLVAKPPSCGCYGLLARFESTMTGSLISLGRNAALLGLLVTGTCLNRRSPRFRTIRSRSERLARPSNQRLARGFTLIEAVGAIALVGVLVALTLPSLSGVRRRAKEAVSINNLRQHAATMTLYADDNAEAFPYFTDPYARVTYLRTNSGNYRAHYFTLHGGWNYALADDYFGGDPFHSSHKMPYAQFFGPSSYYYSDCFIARPEFWNPLTRMGPTQWAGTRQSDVQFPSLKGIVRERHSWTDTDTGRPIQPGPAGTPNEPIRFSRVDGSAGGVHHRQLLPFMQSGLAQYPSTSYIGYGVPIMHTLDGVRGRDVE